MSHFWSSVLPESYIEPKREFQAIGLIDFVQPFLIQSMTKPGFSSISTVTAKKYLKNGTIKTENHYNADYKLKGITLTIIDAHDAPFAPAGTNQSEKLFDLLSAGGFTSTSNMMGSFRELLRFPAIQILELLPTSGPQAEEIEVEDVIISAGLNALAGGSFGMSLKKGLLDMVEAWLPGAMISGVWTIFDPVITSVDFGTISYESENIVKITISLDYNNFKFEKALM